MGWVPLKQLHFRIIFRSDGNKYVAEFDESEGVITRLVAEEDEDERENVADVWRIKL